MPDLSRSRDSGLVSLSRCQELGSRAPRLPSAAVQPAGRGTCYTVATTKRWQEVTDVHPVASLNKGAYDFEK
jgi:hypothetical protein